MLLAFFVIGLSVMYRERVTMFFEEGKNFPPESKEALIQTPEEEKMFTGETIAEPIDATGWDIYQNKWYGFEIKHPDSWKNNTQYKTATEKSAVYETIYKFRKDGEEDGDVYVGYDVKIYPLKKVQSVEETNDVRRKENVPEDAGECDISEEADSESGDVSPQKVSIDGNNSCYEPAYFYNVTKGNYIYNIVPAVGKSGERFSNPEKETTRRFPEYKEAVDSFKPVSVARPQPKLKPRITARRPVAAKIVGGKLICAKRNDHPRKSRNGNKPGHLDLECCLDPDERPNPWCAY